MTTIKPLTLIGLLAVLPGACGGVTNGSDGGGGTRGGGGAAGGGAGGTTGAGVAGGTTGRGGGGAAGAAGAGGAVGSGGGGTSGHGGGGTKGAGGGGTKGGPPVDASDDVTSPTPDAAFDSALPDGSSSPLETFEILAGTTVEHPLECPTSNWEFKSLPSSITLRNTGSVPLAYISESGWISGVVYSPGYPTSQSMEQVGVLAPGAEVTLNVKGSTVGLVGASKPFSTYDGGFAPADEWTIPWPLGVSGSGGATTMYVAEIEVWSVCSPVIRPG